MNDEWINFFIFFLIVDKPEMVTNVISSDDCEAEFDRIIRDAESIEPEEFKSRCLEWLTNKKDKLLELNNIYKGGKNG